MRISGARIKLIYLLFDDGRLLVCTLKTRKFLGKNIKVENVSMKISDYRDKIWIQIKGEMSSVH